MDVVPSLGNLEGSFPTLSHVPVVFGGGPMRTVPSCCLLAGDCSCLTHVWFMGQQKRKEREREREWGMEREKYGGR